MNKSDSELSGAEAVDARIAKGEDLDGLPIPEKKLSLYNDVMGLEANRKRSGASNIANRSKVESPVKGQALTR